MRSNRARKSSSVVPSLIASLIASWKSATSASLCAPATVNAPECCSCQRSVQLDVGTLSLRRRKSIASAGSVANGFPSSAWATMPPHAPHAHRRARRLARVTSIGNLGAAGELCHQEAELHRARELIGWQLQLVEPRAEIFETGRS